MKTILRCFLLFSFLCCIIQSSAQLLLSDINMDQIQHKKIRKYIETQIEENKLLLSDIQPSCYPGKDLSLYRKNEMTFLIRGNFKDIWQDYISDNPVYSWNGRKISFGVLLERFPNNIFYNNDAIDGVNIGQVYFLNLKVLKGIYNIPVAFEIITVDTIAKLIEFSYLEGNKSLGVQQIRFLNIDNQNTKIVHTSYFKSDSKFRDIWMYPFFHKKIVRDFHRNMRKLLDLEKIKKKDFIKE